MTRERGRERERENGHALITKKGDWNWDILYMHLCTMIGFDPYWNWNLWHSVLNFNNSKYHPLVYGLVHMLNNDFETRTVNPRNER